MPPKRNRSVKRNDLEDYDYSLIDEEDSTSISLKVSKKRAKTQDISEAPELQNYSHLHLKKDHMLRPIWVTPSGLIILEAFSPVYPQVYDFLVAIAEPVARPEFIHKYQLTPNSLYAAVSVSMDTQSIISYLGRFCKTELPIEVIKFITDATATFGKAKLVLKDNKYYVESSNPEVLRNIFLKQPIIANARRYEDDASKKTEDGFEISLKLKELKQNLEFTKIGKDLNDDAIEDEEEDEEETYGGDMGGIAGSKLQTVSFMIAKELMHDVKKCALDMQYPLMEEYDFANDTRNPNLSIDLKTTTQIRLYQEKSLSKMFGNGRARSGIIVLPCGAGKSLTGVTAAQTIKKSTMVICPNNVSVKQWRDQFTSWTTVAEDKIFLFTAEFKMPLPPVEEACILLTTYTMICYGGQRAEGADVIMNNIVNREWGLMILDEVHVAPASRFRTVLHIISAHCKLGLTATLVREDDKIVDLNFLIGPKLYEANWMDLTQQGYLANVQCSEIWCPMTGEFYKKYLEKGLPKRRQQLLYIMNPTKFRVCEFLVKYHTDRGDKVIIFSDDTVALQLYCGVLQQPFIYGATPEQERIGNINAFRSNPLVNCLGLSKVGDTALDIPEANVIIQVASHFGARRQEAQRLGRILRPKANMTSGVFNAFFYTLVSTDTREMYYSAKRQQYLIDQGYTFKVVQDLYRECDAKSTLLRTKSQEIDLLNQIINKDDKTINDLDTRDQNFIRENEEVEGGNALPGGRDISGRDGNGDQVKRRVSTMSAMSGAGGSRYINMDAASNYGL